jgi:hypothetical protein
MGRPMGRKERKLVARRRGIGGKEGRGGGRRGMDEGKGRGREGGEDKEGNGGAREEME